MRSSILVVGILIAIVLAGCAQEEQVESEVQATTPSPAEVTEIKIVENPSLGKILVDADGMTLYIFTTDEEGKSNCYEQCAVNWPPLIAEGDIKTPEGMEDKFGTAEREDGTMQVTYDGMPLYYFINDNAPGDANGEGVNGVWFVVKVESESEAEETPVATVTVSEPEEVTIAIKNFAFEPDSVTIKVGAKVTWTNEDYVSHTVTSEEGVFDSGTLGNGETFSYTFEEAGTYEYICTIHPSMKGEIIVTE